MDNPLILQLLQKLHHLSCANKTIHLCWIPSHIGIRYIKTLLSVKSPIQTLNPTITFYFKQMTAWSYCRDNEILQIKPTLGEWLSGCRSRKEEVVLSRLRIDHTYFLQKLHHQSCANETIHLCWIPSHIGIRGNEAADMAAKKSLYQDITVSQVPYTDFKSHMNFFISGK